MDSNGRSRTSSSGAVHRATPAGLKIVRAPDMPESVGAPDRVGLQGIRGWNCDHRALEDPLRWQGVNYSQSLQSTQITAPTGGCLVDLGTGNRHDDPLGPRDRHNRRRLEWERPGRSQSTIADGRFKRRCSRRAQIAGPESWTSACRGCRHGLASREISRFWSTRAANIPESPGSGGSTKTTRDPGPWSRDDRDERQGPSGVPTPRDR